MAHFVPACGYEAPCAKLILSRSSELGKTLCTGFGQTGSKGKDIHAPQGVASGILGKYHSYKRIKKKKKWEEKSKLSSIINVACLSKEAEDQRTGV